MRQAKKISGRMEEQGVILTLVAVFMLFVVGAMAALSIDAVTLYTARSEAQLAADAAALAGARVFANSGMTSATGNATLASSAETLASTVASQVAQSNQVGGRNLAAGEVTVSFPNLSSLDFGTNPQVKVHVQRTDLPTFFARIWGSKQLAVTASATAEAYNPSGASALGGTVAPVAPSCVKPWVLPNLSPTGAPSIIDRTTGAIMDTTLLGKDLTAIPLEPVCAPGTCGGSTLGTPQAWKYFSEDVSGLPAAGALAACAAGFNASQNSIAGCIQTPVACGSTVNLEKIHGSLRTQTANAVNCLIHASTSATTADTVDPKFGPPLGLPFHFLAGADNPLVLAGAIPVSTAVLVSDSIVTVPIYDDGTGLGNQPATSVPIVGFVQVFVSINGAAIPNGGSDPNRGKMNAMAINIAGCGTGATGQAILGNGASPVAVRLITP
jgi:putative Flp pilus-assembly TadE/G-like protein